MFAACCNLPEACEVLLEAGGDVNATDIDGNTAAHLAYSFSSMRCVNMIENNEAYHETPNFKGLTPLECAGMYMKCRGIYDLNTV
jgi:ankyrin repeat protein